LTQRITDNILELQGGKITLPIPREGKEQLLMTSKTFVTTNFK